MSATRSVVNELSAYGVARASVAGAPLSEAELRKTHAFWNACNYLAVGMIYLQANPLLREPLKPEHIKNQEVNPFVELAYEHRTFFTRLHHFVLASDAFIVAPGGIGTVLETMMIWQLLQVRHLEHTPLIMVGKMWPGLVAWVREAMLSFETPLINPEDVDIPVCVANSDEAIAIIRRHKDAQAAAQTA